MRACPRCQNTAVIEDGYCGACRECTMPSLVAPPRSARSGLEMIQSLRREGWSEDIMGVVMVSRDKSLLQIVWPDGRRIEAPNYAEVSEQPPSATPSDTKKL